MDPRRIDAHRVRLDEAIRRGRRLRDTLKADRSDASAIAGVRVWQRACEVAVHELSGGSKRHWLSRAYSDALLVRSSGQPVERAGAGEIVDRIVGVLERAARSLAPPGGAGFAAAEAPRRFDFVRNRDLQPVLEQAYVESRAALDERRFDLSLVTACGVLEAIITDALEHAEASGRTSLAGQSFDERIAAAERAGLIRGACARLPEVARRYRDENDLVVVERDARVAGQVLHAVMRDLDPGR